MNVIIVEKPKQNKNQNLNVMGKNRHDRNEKGTFYVLIKQKVL